MAWQRPALFDVGLAGGAVRRFRKRALIWATLVMLVPYALTSHVRDSAVWLAPDGINVRWVNMGEGNVDIDGWIRKFLQAKPGLPIVFENLVSGRPQVHAINELVSRDR
jgi:hypothetical protein